MEVDDNNLTSDNLKNKIDDRVDDHVKSDFAKENNEVVKEKNNVGLENHNKDTNEEESIQYNGDSEKHLSNDTKEENNVEPMECEESDAQQDSLEKESKNDTSQKENGDENNDGNKTKSNENGDSEPEVSEMNGEKSENSGVDNDDFKENFISENEDGCDVEPPSGWRRKAVKSSESGKQEFDVYYITPTGEKLRSLPEITEYCKKHTLDIDHEKFVFSYRQYCLKKGIEYKGPDSGDPDSLLKDDSNSESQSKSQDANNSASTSITENTSDLSSGPSSPSTTNKAKKAISTSALLRAYRPHLNSKSPTTGKQSEISTKSSESSRPTTRQSDISRPATRQSDRAATRQSTNNQTQNKRKAPSDIYSLDDDTPSLDMDCESEGLSIAQVNKFQKIQESLTKLQLLMFGGQNDKNGGTPPMLNGQASLMSLNLLLLQNTQAAASSPPPPSSSSSRKSAGNVVYSTKNSRSQQSTRPQRNTAKKNANTNISTATTNSVSSTTDDDIQVVKEMRVPSQPQVTSSTTTSSSNTTTAGGGGKNFPLLNIICRPKNTLPPSTAMSQRKELDGKVKSVLVKSAQEFVEWLLSEGMIRTSQFCSIHKIQPSQMPYKLKLGMFSDPKVLSTSGGYVWISECCGKKYVSVYSGSIFGSTPIDKVTPTAVLKLVYHWSCQTSVANVESWVKVDKTFVNKMYNYFRCVCSVMLQDKVYDFGFDGTTVELGIVSLGTSTADGTKKAVKVEILGLYDRKMKSYRLFASEPEPGSSSRQRFIRILKPLERVVHTNAIILCDQSVDRNCLYNMNYGKVSVCETSDNEDNLQSNAKVMSYLRRHVPKMFQSTLSQLSLQQVQIVLDELCWRERFGNSAANAYNTMVEHITYLTSRESENPGVLHLLDFVAQRPHHNWRYKSQHMPKTIPALQPSIIMSTPSAGTINPQVTMDIPTSVVSPLDHNNKVALTPRSRGPSSREGSSTPKATTKTPVTKSVQKTESSAAPKPDAVELEPFYYGQIQGDTSLGREINNYSYTCHLCSDTFNHNVEFYTHLKGHVVKKTGSQKFCCDYCTEFFETQDSKDYHQKFRHLQMDSRYTWCRICTESFPGEFQLVNHMAKKHYESELPYRCEVCNFTTSIYFSIINHFKVEHKGSPYVQCHYCLSVKTINSASASSFSFRMLQHLQKHANQQGKCKSCCLSFYSKYLLDEHKRKDHVSRSNVAGLQRYKVPAGHNKIMFRPWVKRGATNNTQLVHLQPSQTVAISSTLQRLDGLKVNLGEDNEMKYYCIECDASLSLEEHYKAYQKCTKCQYSTCCRHMLSKHAAVFHPNGKSKNGYYRIGPPIILPSEMYCICGFSTCSGNHLARHLALCEGGRKSAYPSLMDAMVYRGDPMAPSVQALSTLGLTRMLPGSVTPEVPGTSTTEAPEQDLDMNNFMSMSMDVDDDDDPPVMPLAVELNE